MSDIEDAERIDAAPEPTDLYGCPRDESRGQLVIHATREGYVDAVKALTDDGYTMCVDLTTVDYLAFPGRTLPPGVEAERFEVVVNLISHTRHERLRIRVQVPEAEPSLPTLFALYAGTEAMEREAFDMFGISFDGHPDLTRILMPEDWVGHPLRKDEAIGRIPVQFKGTADAR